MSKISYLMLSGAFIILTSIVVDALGIDETDNPADRVPTDVESEGALESIWGVVETYLRMVSFRIDDIPFTFNLLFTIVSLGILYVIVSLIRGGS